MKLLALALNCVGTISAGGPGGQTNVLGRPLAKCGDHPTTGFFRDGYCNTGYSDRGTHVVCAEMSQEFLELSAEKGNDLITPRPQYSFPGLKAGDHWCLCALRWEQARQYGVAPKVFLDATHSAATRYTRMENLEQN